MEGIRAAQQRLRLIRVGLEFKRKIVQIVFNGRLRKRCQSKSARVLR